MNGTAPPTDTSIRDAALTVLGVVLAAAAHLAWGRRGLVVDVTAAAFLVPMMLVDLRDRRLPDPLTLGGTAAVLGLLGAQALATGAPGPLAGALAGAVTMAGVLAVLHLASPSGMGFGDVKLGLLLGAVVGSRSLGAVLSALFVAGVAGSLVGIALMVRHRRRRVTLPFGPCLVLGAAVALAWQAA